MLSFATLRKINGMDWRQDHLLSLAGVYKPRDAPGEAVIPLALEQYLKDHPEVKTIRLRLDNDRTGKQASEALMAGLSEQYAVSYQLPPRGKDYNDYLCMVRGLPLMSQESKARER